MDLAGAWVETMQPTIAVDMERADTEPTTKVLDRAADSTDAITDPVTTIAGVTIGDVTTILSSSTAVIVVAMAIEDPTLTVATIVTVPLQFGRVLLR